jgi:hypothetical protein
LLYLEVTLTHPFVVIGDCWERQRSNGVGSGRKHEILGRLLALPIETSEFTLSTGYSRTAALKTVAGRTQHQQWVISTRRANLRRTEALANHFFLRK